MQCHGVKPLNKQRLITRGRIWQMPQPPKCRYEQCGAPGAGAGDIVVARQMCVHYSSKGHFFDGEKYREIEQELLDNSYGPHRARAEHAVGLMQQSDGQATTSQRNEGGPDGSQEWTSLLVLDRECRRN